VASEAVVINFSGDPRPYTSPPREPVVKWSMDPSEHDEDDETWMDEMMGKGPAEFFVDHIVMPLLGLVFAGVLALIASASIWATMKFVLAIKHMH